MDTGPTMEEQDPIPTARLHWTRLVLGRGHPFIIIMVLAFVGTAICWYSLDKVASLTKTPTRYTMDLDVLTDGCADRQVPLRGDIGSFGASVLQLWLIDDDNRPVLRGGCRLRSIQLTSNLALQPYDDLHSAQLIRVLGASAEAIADQASWRDGRYLPDSRVQTVQATVLDDVLTALDQANLPEAAPTFSTGVEEVYLPTGIQQPYIVYGVTFLEAWQPLAVTFTFVVPENVKTYFSVTALRREPLEGRTQEESEDVRLPEHTYEPMDVSVSFRTDDVSVVRGSISDSGDAQAIDGSILFGIENNDAESRRESGNVTYSAILGIGIALLVEAFVILLALGVRALVARLGVRDT